LPLVATRAFGSAPTAPAAYAHGICVRARAGICVRVRAAQIKEYGSLEAFLTSSDKAVADDKVPAALRDNYAEVHKLFTAPDVCDPEATELKWTEPDVEGIVAFMCGARRARARRARESDRARDCESARGERGGWWRGVCTWGP
jgi:hypothetical protein